MNPATLHTITKIIDPRFGEPVSLEGPLSRRQREEATLDKARLIAKLFERTSR